ncbi:tetratricopeptide repeat protein [Turneriella parva]|uniref:Tetratricopeptide repeat-containing protein n=1 Tax=Turneriella parva (strain ATCC BAA-1111 / DSM 21527 / NCTC 11395 / H) TaxID=869212 RepID=I4B3J0_TURPD|nr:restriction endonuclease [Turneriella parva]AFM11847.1 Tetratricopeptide repeat-containing protein [Turneriella parva DSM 21527]
MLYFAVLGILMLLALLAWLLTLRKSNPFHIVQKLMEEGQYDEAVLKLTAMSEDIDLAPRSYIYLAECHEQLGARDLARTCYKKAIDAGAFDDKDREIEIYKKIGEIYRSENDTEGFFEVCLEILRLNPGDELANQEVGMIALGDGHYSVAEIYLKAAMAHSDDPQLVLAYAVTLWQMGECDEAVAHVEKLLADAGEEHIYRLMYVTMATFGVHLARGRQTALKLIADTQDDSVKELLYNIYLYQCYQGKALREALDFLKRQNESNSLPADRRREYQYLLLILYLNEEMFLEASRLYRDLAEIDDEYRDLKHLRVFIDQIDLNPHAENLKPFKQILKDNFEPLLMPDLTYAISGFRKNRGLAITKFFDLSGDRPQLRIEYDVMTAEKSADLFMQMMPEEFQKFVLYIITNLEYNEPVKESSGEKDLVLYSAISSKSKSIRALFAFYRLRTGSHISDISLRNLQNKMQSLKADKTYIISSAQLTEGAAALILKESSLKQFDAEHLAEWLHDYFKSTRRH